MSPPSNCALYQHAYRAFVFKERVRWCGVQSGAAFRRYTAMTQRRRTFISTCATLVVSVSVAASQLALGVGSARAATATISKISAGQYHTCALTTGGGVKCWGYNAYGQLGDGTTTTRSAPIDVTGLTSRVSAVAAGGYHTCALTIAGAVKCWGYNGSSQVGDGTATDRLAAVDVSGL